MKRITVYLFILISAIGYSQVIIGENIDTTEDNRSVLLEFTKTNDRGVILPCVTNDVDANRSQYTEGTILLDAHDTTDARIKFFDGTNWVDLSGNPGDASSVINTQPTKTDEPKIGVIIGAKTTDVNGVMVLESDEKALVLPQVDDTDRVISPAPGMMVYINKDQAKRLAVYNGTTWSYWRCK